MSIKKRSKTILITMLFPSIAMMAQTGKITGVVLDSDTRTPLPGTNVLIRNTVQGAAADLDGQYVIDNVRPGAYVLRIIHIGYTEKQVADVIVRPGRSTVVDVRMHPAIVEGKTVTISAGYFDEADEEIASSVSFSKEEIRRAAGSAGDVSRLMMGLPSVALVDDQSNRLIVRGGSPIENGFYVDNIEIPNINHFPTQGSSGGPIGLLNVDFIRDVSFYSGGFSAVYGDRLSSIMNISFREGNRESIDGQLDLNFSGFGGVVEGPLFGNKGSFLLSARRSYLDILVDVIDVGSSVAPRFGDVQGKIVLDVAKNHRLTFLSIWGDDKNQAPGDQAEENDMVYYGNQDISEKTTGINWRILWKNRGYSNTSLSMTSTTFNEDFFETGTALVLTRNRSEERKLKFRQLNHVRLHKKVSIEFGLESKVLLDTYDYFFGAYTDALGDSVPALNLDWKPRGASMAGFFSLELKPHSRWSATLGLRSAYHSLSKQQTWSPRAALAFQINQRVQCHASAGLFHQSLPLLLLGQNPCHQNLKHPRAMHLILGVEYLVTENSRLTAEVYRKDYDFFPMDPGQPGLFLVDELTFRHGFFFPHAEMVDKGRARSRGIEVMVQKKLATHLYGLASITLSQSQYRGLDGQWRDRVFDNRIAISVEGGYKLNSKWEFSCRWIYAGGRPYTPFDQEKSKALGRGVFDENRINEERYPAYHALNLRFDRRFHFNTSNLIFYLSVWNAYNRKNIAAYYWNTVTNSLDSMTQWRLLPIFGVEYEF